MPRLFFLLFSFFLLCGVLAGCGESGAPGNVETAADGSPVVKQDEAQAEQLETQAVMADEAMSAGGAVAAKAEQAGAKLDVEADAVRGAGETAAAAEEAQRQP